MKTQDSTTPSAPTGSSTATTTTPMTSSPSNPQSKTIVIVGAGPAGLFLAHSLFRRVNEHACVYDICVVEKRSDPRTSLSSQHPLRTYPLALHQPRGLAALRTIPGLFPAVESRGTWFQQSCFYSKARPKPRTMNRAPNLSFDRDQLTTLMLQHLVATVEDDENKNNKNTLKLRFECQCDTIDLDARTLQVTNLASGETSTLPFDHVVAADGANSQMRQALADLGKLDFTRVVNPDEYKTVHLPTKGYPKVTKDDATADDKDNDVFALDPRKLHGWMEDCMRCILVPLEETTASGVVIFPRGSDPFAAMSSVEDVYAYFDKVAPLTLRHLIGPTEAQALLDRPVCISVSITCDRLHVDDCVLLVGDAAHAVSPSLGQGCNSALEDVRFFVQLLDLCNDDWSRALARFTQERLADAHAVSELSAYSMPRTKWMGWEMILRAVLRAVLPTWIAQRLLSPMPIDVIMTDMPYSKVLEKTRWWTDRVKHSLRGGKK